MIGFMFITRSHCTRPYQVLGDLKTSILGGFSCLVYETISSQHEFVWFFGLFSAALLANHSCWFLLSPWLRYKSRVSVDKDLMLTLILEGLMCGDCHQSPKHRCHFGLHSMLEQMRWAVIKIWTSFRFYRLTAIARWGCGDLWKDLRCEDEDWRVVGCAYQLPKACEWCLHINEPWTNKIRWTMGTVFPVTWINLSILEFFVGDFWLCHTFSKKKQECFYITRNSGYWRIFGSLALKRSWMGQDPGHHPRMIQFVLDLPPTRDSSQPQWLLHF